MKIELTKKLEDAIKVNLSQVFEEKKNELNNNKIVDVLQEIGATGSRIFIKLALEILIKANVTGIPNNLKELMEQL